MTESTKEKLLRLRRAYLEALPAKLEAVAASLATARADEALLAAAFTDVHKLKGSTGSYGYAGVSARLAEIHELLYDCVEQKRAPSDDEWQAILARLDAAREAIPPSLP
jgi:chemotaxis protein histidine kinase CheA